MDRQAELMAALNVGSSRILCGLAREDESGRPRLTALEGVPSYGIRNGLIVDLERASESLRLAIEAVSVRMQSEVRGVIVGFSGAAQLSRAQGRLPLGREPRAVREADLALLGARLRPEGAAGRRVVSRYDGPYTVGELHGVERPLGLAGANLEMSSTFVTVSEERVADIIQAVRRAGVEADALLVEPLASSLGGCSEDERALGVAVLDLGAGGFRGAFWEGGRLRQLCVAGARHPFVPSGVVPASEGLEGVATVLARRFRIPVLTARRVLERFGTQSRHEEGQSHIAVGAVDGAGRLRIDLREWSETLVQYLNPVIRELRDGLSGFSNGHPGGVVLVGQGAGLRGLPPIVSRHFGGVPVRLANPVALFESFQGPDRPSGWRADFEGPGLSALYGLLRYGIQERRRLREERRGRWAGFLRQSLARLRASMV